MDVLRTRTKALVAAGALGLTLTACGGADDASVAATAGESEGAAPASPEATEAVEEPAVAADILELTAWMQEAQLEQGSAHVEAGFSGSGAELAGLSGTNQVIDFRFGETLKETAMSMSMSLMGTSMDMIMVDGWFYMDMSEATGGEVAYVGTAIEDLAGDPSVGGTLGMAESMDYVAQAELIADAVTAFEHTGVEAVDGQELQSYTVTIDPAALPAGAGPAGVDASSADVISEMEAVYRVDADGLLYSGETRLVAEGEELIMTMQYSDWGEPVDITAPPADQVTDWNEATGG